MKKIIQFKLRILSRLILKKYKPHVIGITGSVGKTSTKMAIHTLLKDDYPVRASQKNYNTQTGVPLTIIGLDHPARSIWGWLTVFLKATWLLIKKDKNYPHILILELAADHPGDIQYLSRLARPQIGVLTSVAPAHLEFFGSLDRVAQEKATLLTNLASSAYAVVNSDQTALLDLSKTTKAKLITFGLKDADLTASDITMDKRNANLQFNLSYQRWSAPVSVPRLLGQPAIYSLLAAAAVGLCYNLELSDIAAKLQNYQSQPGRLNLLPGIKYTKLIDDSYNSSPLAAQAALDVLAHLSCTGSKFAVLGDMLELGDYTQTAHRRTGQSLAKLSIDYLITVGQRSLDIAASAREYGMNPDRIFSFDSSVEAGKFLQDKIEQGDLILIKGSAGMAMEKITKEIMAEPDRAQELLVRQD